MRLRLPVLAATLLLTTACLGGLETPNGRFGTISASALDNGGGGYVMDPEAAFYGDTDLGYTPFPNDTCIVLAFSNSTTVNNSLITLNAGDRLFTSVSGRIDTLAPIPNINIRVYSPVRTSGIPFLPGDTLSITVPGNPSGFPASAISVRTAEPFTHSTIGIPSENQSVTVTWTPAPAPGSQMTFSLRYANATSTTGLNEQVFCSFNDDGAAVIGADYLNGWRTALSDQRSTRAVRIRSREIAVDTRTRLSIISSFAQPLPVFVP